jgi:hypothetical protein
VIPSTYPSDPPLAPREEISSSDGLRAAKRLAQAAIQTTRENRRRDQTQRSPILGSRAPNLPTRTTAPAPKTQRTNELEDGTDRARALATRFIDESQAQRRHTRQMARDDGIYHLFQRHLSHMLQTHTQPRSQQPELKRSGPA